MKDGRPTEVLSADARHLLARLERGALTQEEGMATDPVARGELIYRGLAFWSRGKPLLTITQRGREVHERVN